LSLSSRDVFLQEMSRILSDLLERFEPDEWRQVNGFSPEVHDAQTALFEASETREVQEKIINNWIQKHQPCLFGRAAASQRALHYCLIHESDICEGDEAVRRRVLDGHLSWTRQAFEGRSSGFVLLVLSRRVTEARPNDVVLEFAKALARIYLQEDEIEANRIYHDAAYLAIPDHRERVLKWKAGINYFSAHGDQRWWQDHRIPGGLGFSTNSVGHLAKSGKLLSVLDEYIAQLGMSEDKRYAPRIDSLGKALTVAMQTIDNASNAASGKATELLPLPADLTTLAVEVCPYKLPSKLESKNFCSYRGYYHTDFTLPSEYFRPEVERPGEIKAFDNLDFTYLFRDSLDNPSHETMGQGVPIRADSSAQTNADRSKDERWVGRDVPVADEYRLVEALKFASA
jgi:hypothetical protein